ncbi:MAG TPA: zinc ribbon domain-containing protein [Thermoleophilia bacterium]
MPLYEYRCEACGETFEIVTSLADRDENAVCPACGAHHTTRVFSPIMLAGKRTSMNPQNFVRPHGPVTPPKPATPKMGAKD